MTPSDYSAFIPQENADEWRHYTTPVLCSHRNIPMENFYILATDGVRCIVQFVHSLRIDYLTFSSVVFPKGTTRDHQKAAPPKETRTKRAPRRSITDLTPDELLSAFLDFEKGRSSQK